MIADENRWQAVRHGMSAFFVGPGGTPVSAFEAVDELLVRVAEDAAAMGSGWTLVHLRALAERGGRAAELRDTMLRTDDAVAVTRHLVDLGLRDLETTPSAGRELVTG
jgi:gamma-glutamyl:cysteine ligase YbdK (ATP-grasp superfamily)